ncbi:MAG: aldose epimerase family protein [Ferruginibacter sp.]
MQKEITITLFGEFENKPVSAYQISNNNGMQVELINYGATITKIITPDRAGVGGNVLLGFDSLDGYLQNGHMYLGSIVGRYCNRIAHAKFTLHNTEYHLAANNETACLHGGITGFDKVCWDAQIWDGNRVKFSYLSEDGEEGFPGNLQIEIIYTLTDENELIIEYSGSTDKTTPVNLTSHGYFNLSAFKEPTVLDHELVIFANQYTTQFHEPVEPTLIASVKDGPLDFTKSKKIGRDIKQLPGGFDHNYVLNKTGENALEKAAGLYDPTSGRVMDVFTTEPGLQLYTGNFIELAAGYQSDNDTFINHAAVCLEAQHFPNSPNEPVFPGTILNPGETYRQQTVYKFSIR